MIGDYEKAKMERREITTYNIRQKIRACGVQENNGRSDKGTAA